MADKNRAQNRLNVYGEKYKIIINMKKERRTIKELISGKDITGIAPRPQILAIFPLEQKQLEHYGETNS